MIDKKELEKILLNDLDKYEKRLAVETNEFMRHYYQGKIDYISQLSAQLDLEVLDQI